MNNKKLTILLILTIFCIGISLTSVSANNNTDMTTEDSGVLKQTVEDSFPDNENECSNNLNSSSDYTISSSQKDVAGYDYEDFQPRIIPEGYGYRQNIPQQINYSSTTVI